MGDVSVPQAAHQATRPKRGREKELCEAGALKSELESFARIMSILFLLLIRQFLPVIAAQEHFKAHFYSPRLIIPGN